MSALTYSAKETAEMLGVSYDWLITNLKALPHHRLGRLIKFTDADHQAILRLHERTPDSGAGHGLSPVTAARFAEAAS